MASQGMNREDLIGALAAAMGQGGYSATKYEESRYDTSTGTLYCQGYIISKTSVDEALEFFRNSKKRSDRMAETDPNARNSSLYFQVAIEAIQMMQKQAILNGGKVIAPTSDNK
ncbi:MAG: hypothetical protein IKO80_06730 [Lachnospiraceae bacterium]|nr:hypothetical protein [Lachnospiraceae bacterium]